MRMCPASSIAVKSVKVPPMSIPMINEPCPMSNGQSAMWLCRVFRSAPEGDAHQDVVQRWEPVAEVGRGRFEQRAVVDAVVHRAGHEAGRPARIDVLHTERRLTAEIHRQLLLAQPGPAG